jgi:hypothetical protein
MTGFPGSPKLLKGGIVLVDPASGAMLRVISLQYNPDTLTRSLQIQAAGGEGGGGANRSQALRLKGNPVETIKLEATLDATDQLEFPDRNPAVVRHGLHPELAVLEALVYPRSADLRTNDQLAGSGTLEVLPIEAPLSLFVWSRSRIVPVRVTELSITEEAFDIDLNPIRAKASLGLRVLSVDDLGFGHRGGAIFMSYLQGKEALAGQAGAVTLSALGLEGLP